MSSARTSASSGMYPFPRQMPPNTNGYYEEGQGHQGTRFTAPAIARQREPSLQNGGYQSQQGPPPGRMSGRPGMHSAQQMPGNPRNRSASSPDIHNQPRGPGPMRGPPPSGPPPTGAIPQPPVPDMPAGYAQQSGISRTHNASPSLQMQNGAPPQRGMSPQMHHNERYHSQQMQQRQQIDTFPGPQRPNFSAYPRTVTPVNRDESFTPPASSPPSTNLRSASDRAARSERSARNADAVESEGQLSLCLPNAYVGGAAEYQLSVAERSYRC